MTNKKSNNDTDNQLAIALDSASNSNSSCGDYLTFKIKIISNAIAKNGKKLVNKSKSLSKSINDSIQNSSITSKSKSKSANKNKNKNKNKTPPSSIKPEDITMQLGSAYLRRIDFSSIEAPSVKMDDSGYFNSLFSPPPIKDIKSNPVKIKHQQTDIIQMHKVSKRKPIYSKSASSLL